MRLLERAGITRAVAYTILARCWSVMSGPISLLVIARYYTVAEQGIYYTFWSVVALQIVFELGVSFVITQFASHERAHLVITHSGISGAQHAQVRLASIMRLSLRWYGVAAVLMLVCVLPAGMAFFGRYSQGADLHWGLPWLLLVTAVAVNLVIVPFSALMEGCGFIADISLMRLFQGAFANILFWIAVVLGGSLYAAAILSGATALFAIVWLGRRYGSLVRALLRVPKDNSAVSWRNEVWPFQWRIAVSWISGYAIFQLFNPILFATRGVEAAAQMGMSLSVSSAIANLAYAWISVRAVDYGSMIAARRLDALEVTFRTTLWQSTTVAVVLATGFFGMVQLLRYFGHPFASRILPAVPLLLLLCATAANHIVVAEATYLRAFKREPFVGISVAVALVTSCGSLLTVSAFGPTGMMASYLVGSLVFGVGAGTVIFIRKRREWFSTLEAV